MWRLQLFENYLVFPVYLNISKNQNLNKFVIKGKKDGEYAWSIIPLSYIVQKILTFFWATNFAQTFF